MTIKRKNLLRRITALLERRPGELVSSYDTQSPQGLRLAIKDVLERQDRMLRMLKESVELD